MISIAILWSSAALADYTEHAGFYCVGNHPGVPAYTGNESVVECRARCDGLGADCACFDTTQHAGQYPCRIVGDGDTRVAKSSAGYSAFTRNVPPAPVGGPVVINISVGAAEGRGTPLRHFWRSCGWCPPDPHPRFPEYFGRDDVAQNHVLIGSTPHGGVEFVRIHYLFDLLRPATNLTAESAIMTPAENGYLARRLSTIGIDSIALDWSALDAAMDQLHEQGLLPGFELMGNPGAADDRSDRIFTSFAEREQVLAWRDLVMATASRYIARFGADVVQRWRFESWNEPEGQCHRNLTVGIVCDIDSFLAYWDACAMGLRAAEANAGLAPGALVFGGTASDGTKEFLHALVSHCLNGTNFIDGSPGCGGTPSFLNAHLKGDESARGIVDKELPVALETFSRTAGTALDNERVPWGNDEADPKVGWSHTYDWRGDARYPAMVTKAIAQHQMQFVRARNISYDVLSNDNGFLPYATNDDATFEQRTLVARWALNASEIPGAQHDTYELVRKPVLNGMALLSRLGNVWHGSSCSGPGTGASDTASLGVLATSRGVFSDRNTSVEVPAEIVALVYNSADKDADPKATANVTLRLSLDAAAAAKFSVDTRVALVRLDNSHGNALAIWQAQGKPRLPSLAQFSAIRAAAEMVVEPGFPRPLSISATSITDLSFDVPQPGLALVQICTKPASRPTPVTRVRLHIPPRAAANLPQALLLQWDANDDETHRCLASYAVYCGDQLVSKAGGTMFNAFAHTQNYTDISDRRNSSNYHPACCYSVTAHDFWGRASVPSKAVCPNADNASTQRRVGDT
eukprot:g1442.t1